MDVGVVNGLESDERDLVHDDRESVEPLQDRCYVTNGGRSCTDVGDRGLDLLRVMDGLVM